LGPGIAKLAPGIAKLAPGIAKLAMIASAVLALGGLSEFIAEHGPSRQSNHERWPKKAPTAHRHDPPRSTINHSAPATSIFYYSAIRRPRQWKDRIRSENPQIRGAT
jgi:hypothetical protein